MDRKKYVSGENALYVERNNVFTGCVKKFRDEEIAGTFSGVGIAYN
jgi:hypothetical protein